VLEQAISSRRRDGMSSNALQGQGHPRWWYWGVQAEQLTLRQAWVCLAAMFFLGFMCFFGLIRVGPVMPVLQEEFGFTLANVGLIQSFFTIAGVLLMYPGTWIMRKVGLKITIIVAAAFSIVGALIGFVAESQTLFLASRAVEGVGAGIVMFMGANVCTRIFPAKKLGLAMAVWSLWAPAGSFLALWLTPYIYAAWGWRSLFLITAIAYALAFVWLLVSFKLPKVNENEITVQNSRDGAAGGDLKTKAGKRMFVSSLVLAVTFVFWGWCFGGATNSFWPTYLMEVKGLSMADAGFWPAIISLASLPLGIAFGLLSDKLGTRKWFVVISYAILAVSMGFFAWGPGPEMYPVVINVVIVSICSAAIPMATRAAIPEYTPDTKVSDYMLTTMVFFGNLGQFLVVFFGTTVAAAGWQGGGLYLLMPINLVAAATVLFLCKNDFKGFPKKKAPPDREAA
jgi:MFS family permease